MEVLDYICRVLALFVPVLTPMVLYLWKLCVKLKTAKAEDKPDILMDILDNLVKYMAQAEIQFSQLNAELKAKSAGKETAGSTKLGEVLSKVKMDCLERGITFSEEYWADKIHRLCEMAKIVNK